jgi:hypothetical protein
VSPPDLVGRGGQPLSVRISNVSAVDYLYADNVRTGGFGCAVPNVDECADSSHTCDANATCVDNAAGYSCGCNAGLSGTGGGTPVNPSFESGLFNGWTASGSATDVHNPIASGEANNPFSGSYLARLRNGGAAPATLEQALGAVDAARTYTVTVDLGVFGATSANYEVQLSAGATLLMSDSGIVTGSVAARYTKVKTATVTVGPAVLAGHAGQQLLLTIVAASNGQSLIVDNVRTTGFGCAPPPPAPKLVFATSATFTGDSLGGVAGADAKCAAAAAAAARPGTFLAWLSDDAASPATRFAASASGWALVNGTVVAGNFADLVDGSLAAAIDVDENGVVLGAGRAWTGTQANGASLANPANTSCSFWTGPAQFGGITGFIHTSDSTWSAVGADDCANANHLYCFQQ